MPHFKESQRYQIGRKFFIHAPPFKGRRSKETGEFLSKRLARIQPPFREADPWQCSSYYFWWEFLRRHEGYKDCCQRLGKGSYAKLYTDFGNVHAVSSDEFWNWWSEKVGDGLSRGEYLFAEPDARKIQMITKNLTSSLADTLVIRIPLEVRTAYLVRSFRKLLAENSQSVKSARKVSRSKYPINSVIRLNSLWQTLKVWDLWVEHKNTKIKKYELCDLAGIFVNEVVDRATVEMLAKENLPTWDTEKEVRRRKTQAFNRYVSAAEDYIHFVGLGEFPKRKNQK
jgi:hypothetical protein